MGPDAMNFIFWSILSQLFHSLLSPSSRGVFCHWSGIIHLSEITAISPGNLDFSLWFIQPSISHDVLWLFNQGDSVQPWHTLSPILNQSIIPCLVLTVASWPTYTFLRRQVKWHLFKNFPQFIMITVKGFSIVNEEEVDVFLELPCFLRDPTNVDNLISGSSAFSKPSLYIWKFLVHVQLKPSLKDIELHLTSTRVFLGGSDDRESDSKVGNLSSGPWVRKIPWRRGMATHSSVLAWRNP